MLLWEHKAVEKIIERYLFQVLSSGERAVQCKSHCLTFRFNMSGGWEVIFVIDEEPTVSLVFLKFAKAFDLWFLDWNLSALKCFKLDKIVLSGRYIRSKSAVFFRPRFFCLCGFVKNLAIGTFLFPFWMNNVPKYRWRVLLTEYHWTQWIRIQITRAHLECGTS